MDAIIGLIASSKSRASPAKDKMTQRAIERRVTRGIPSVSSVTSSASRAASMDSEPRSKLNTENNAAPKSREPEIKGHGGRISALEDALQSKEREVKKLQEEISFSLQTFKEALSQKNEELELVCSRLNSLSESHQSQETNLKNLTSSLSAVEGRLRNTNLSWEKTQSELSNCRDELFQMQPVAQVPDSEIVHDFETLCQNITNWIDEEISNYESSHPEASPDQIFSDGGNANLLELMDAFPEAGEHFVRYHVHHYLCQEILGSDIQLLGLTTVVAQAIQAAEESMHHLTPARDSAIINSWRSETFRALAATSQFHAQNHKQIVRLTTELFSELNIIFPALSNEEEALMRLCDQVMLPASDLAIKIHLSLSHYELRLQDEPFGTSLGANRRSLEHYRLVDIGTRKTLKPDSAVVADSNGHIGKLVIPLEPRFVRVDGDDKQVQLKPKTYLVKLFHPLGKRGHGSHGSH